jgi:hypothetical protein
MKVNAVELQMNDKHYLPIRAVAPTEKKTLQ